MIYFICFEAAAAFFLQRPVAANALGFIYLLFIYNSVALASPEDQDSS